MNKYFRTIVLSVLVVTLTSCKPVDQNDQNGSRWFVSVAEGVSHIMDYEGELPPIRIETLGGTRVHSWRTLISQFVEASDCRYDFGTSWNDGKNRQMVLDTQHLPDLERNPKSGIQLAFCFDTNHPSETCIVMLEPSKKKVVPIGKRTYYELRKRSDLVGVQGTFDEKVILLRMTLTPIHWMEPRDYTLAELFAPEPDGLLDKVRQAATISKDGKIEFFGRSKAIDLLRRLSSLEARNEHAEKQNEQR